jgi:uncharacterized caspase-like protein
MGISLDHGIGVATAVFRALLLVALVSGQAAAQDAKPLKGFALVIGESAYETLAPLPNPEHDARAIEDLLTGLGFETDLVTDAKEKKLRRTIDGFIEDAEGADVALVYYSGHGIEAGGTNYLIPVDADLKALDAADETLISLQGILEDLRKKARVTILLLDACRSDPFPQGSLVRTASDKVGKPITLSGLGVPRGAQVIETGNPPPENIGEVIGFAAEPGKAALDGTAGANSPYAAALLKHLGANQGFDFGQVMTMVTEEVYLATGTHQRPWTNASLRRLLSFGGSVEQASPDETLLVGERRKLLLTIAATPADLRLAVETLAQDQALPLDPLYGMLKELQVDTSAGPAELDAQLRIGAENLRKLLTEKVVPLRKDPELTRLASLADRAQAEGAISLAKDYRAKAAARADELDKTLDQREAEINADRLELASTYADYGDAAVLNFDYRLAAEQYAKAFEQADGRDAMLALHYKQDQANALVNHGSAKGDITALKSSLPVFEQALALAQRNPAHDDWARTQNDLGVALRRLGETESSDATLNKAVAAFEAALGVLSREPTSKTWAMAQSNLGNTYLTLGTRSVGTELLDRAAAAHRAALAVLTREADPIAWAMAQNNLGNALSALGERETGTQALNDAVAAYDAALTVLTRKRSPIQWALCQHDLGIVWLTIGERQQDEGAFKLAMTAFSAALQERTRDRFPLDWATTMSQFAAALSSLGKHRRNAPLLAEAVRVYDLALTERTRERVPLQWASVMSNIGQTKLHLGVMTGNKSIILEGRGSVEAAWRAYQAMGITDNDPYYRKLLQLFDDMLREMK